MDSYEFRSVNTGKISKTRIGGAVREYLDYFNPDYFDIPKSFYPIMAVGIPSGILGLFWYSLWNCSPIEKIKKNRSVAIYTIPVLRQNL